MEGKILITQGSTAFAQRIAKKCSDLQVLFAVNDEVSTFLLHTGKYFSLPKSDSSTFVHELLKLALDKEIDYILPLNVQEAKIISVSNILFQEYGVAVLVSESSILEETPYLFAPPREISLMLSGIGNDKPVPSKYKGVSGVWCTNDDDEVYLCFAN